MIEQGRWPAMEEIEIVEEVRSFFAETPLSVDEQERFEVYEASIEASFSAQTAGVLSAERIRKERLWRGKWESFAHYCEDRWQVSQEQMNRRIRAARVMQALGSNMTEPEAGNGVGKSKSTPNVQQAVELSKLEDPEEQRAVWSEVLAEASEEQPVTAKRVEQAVAARKSLETDAGKGFLRERAFTLAAQIPEERDAARALVMMPGLPADRAIGILERLVKMEPARSAALLRQWQSPDEREQKAAFAVMQEKHPPADPRRLILESLLGDLIHCREMFPEDELMEDFCVLVNYAEALILSLRLQEENRNHATVSH